MSESKEKSSGLNPLVVLFVLAVIVAVDIIAIQQLGTNANSTFSFVGRPSIKPPVVELIDVPIAASELPVGTSFTRDGLAELLRVRGVRPDSVRPDEIVNADELIGRRLLRAVKDGETVTRNDLATPFVPDTPDGKKSVAVAFGNRSALAAFLQVGSRIDVMATVRTESRATAAVIAKGVAVVALGDGETVTLALNPEQAFVIELANARGAPLSMVLRTRTTQPAGELDIKPVVEMLATLPEAIPSPRAK